MFIDNEYSYTAISDLSEMLEQVGKVKFKRALPSINISRLTALFPGAEGWGEGLAD
jgi:hypothetical protein